MLVEIKNSQGSHSDYNWVDMDIDCYTQGLNSGYLFCSFCKMWILAITKTLVLLLTLIRSSSTPILTEVNSNPTNTHCLLCTFLVILHFRYFFGFFFVSLLLLHWTYSTPITDHEKNNIDLWILNLSTDICEIVWANCSWKQFMTCP